MSAWIRPRVLTCRPWPAAHSLTSRALEEPGRAVRVSPPVFRAALVKRLNTSRSSFAWASLRRWHRARGARCLSAGARHAEHGCVDQPSPGDAGGLGPRVVFRPRCDHGSNDTCQNCHGGGRNGSNHDRRGRRLRPPLGCDAGRVPSFCNRVFTVLALGVLDYQAQRLSILVIGWVGECVTVFLPAKPGEEHGGDIVPPGISTGEPELTMTTVRGFTAATS